MFKIIPGNKTHTINLSQEFRSYSGDVISLPVVNGLVSIELYGQLVKVCPNWLSLIAHFEIYLPNQTFESLLNVNFVDTNITFLRPVSSKVPVFIKPVIITLNNKQYRVIPSYCKYAVSCDGEIIEISTKDIVKISLGRKKHGVIISGYPGVYIYNPELMSFKYVLVHRLVAMGWVKNSQNNFLMRPLVNHKDGDKGNYHFSNLEWCSFKENNNHAADTGLSDSHVKCSIRDFRNGNVTVFRSLADAEKYMGLKLGTLRSNTLVIRKSKLYADRYELKLDSDKSPWFYENSTEKVKNGRYIISVTNTDGVTDYYHDTRDFKNKFKLWNCPNIKLMLVKAKAENAGLTFKYIDYYNNKSIQSFNTETSEILETKTIVDMSSKVGISDYIIRYCLNGSERWVKGKYAFRYKSDDEWDKNFIDMNDARGSRLKVTNILSGEVLKFNSIRETARHFKIDDRYWLRQCILQGKEYLGWKFEFDEKTNGK